MAPNFPTSLQPLSSELVTLLEEAFLATETPFDQEVREKMEKGEKGEEEYEDEDKYNR